MTVSGFLSGRPERVDRYGDPMPILAAIDQAEEMFRGPTFRENERLAFLGQLADAVRDHDGLHLLLSLREEYLFTVLPHERALGQGSRARFHLLPLTRETALEAATLPLNHTDRFFAPGAAELLVDDLRTVTISNDEGIETELTLDSVEPVQLQVVCSALWESLPPGLHEITMEHTRLYADVDRFLVRFCRRVLTEVSEEHDVPVSQIQFWLRNAFITEHGTRNTVYEGLRETAGMPNAVARSLEDRHILKAEHRLGIRWYELQHDRLIGPIHRHESPSVYLKEAREALARKSWAPARKLAEEAVRASRFEEVWVRAEATEIFGEVAASEGEIETARRHFEEAADMFAAQQRFDGVARVLTADGRLWLAQGAHDRAIQQFKTALSWVPNDVPAQLALGEALWHSGEPSAALALSQRRAGTHRHTPRGGPRLPRRDPRGSGSGRGGPA